MFIERFGLDGRTVRILWTLAIAWVLYQIRSLLFVVVISILFAYVLLPLVNFIDQHVARKRRNLAIALVYIALVATISGVSFTVGSYATEQATLLGEKLKSGMQDNQAWTVPLPEFTHSLAGRTTYDLKPWLKRHGEQFAGRMSQLTFRLIAVLGGAFDLLLILVFSLFFLAGGDTLARWFLDALPESRREKFRDLFDSMDVLLGQYMRALVTIAVITSAIYGIGLTAMGVPYSLLLAIMALPFEFIPTIGPLISTAIILFVALLSGYSGVLWVLVFLIVVRLVQDYVIQPRLMAQGVQMPPLAVMLGVLAGQELAGIAGALLSVPVLATARILIKHFVKLPGWTERPK